MRKATFLLLAIGILLPSLLIAQPPKREFRGAWIHTVGNKDYQTMTTDEMKKHFVDLLDNFQKAGINAVIFQVRPQADAFFVSTHEPWSRFITGTQGKAPEPFWDPSAFIIEECHKRSMEFHAWFNPYRVTSNDQEKLCDNHLYYSKSYLFVTYGGQIYFDPGEPESREHTKKVIADFVTRYDVDAIHFDDYFYPYRVDGKEFPDDKSFAKYHQKDGFKKDQRDDWRRNNINVLVKELNVLIKTTKPWVKFGISPFGVWRNKSVDPSGSESEAGQTNYDDLFADIKLWVENEWIDYNAPQLYWEIGHKRADYTPLIKWWSENNRGAQLYIGQNIGNTINAKPDGNRDSEVKGVSQLNQKMKMVREDINIHGNIWWPGYAIPKNPEGFTDSLINDYQRHPALVPLFKHIDSIPPAPLKELAGRKTTNGKQLVWIAEDADNEMDKAAYFCVYKFGRSEIVDLEDATKLMKVTRDAFYFIPKSENNGTQKYVITVLDRLFNESEPRELVF